MPSMVAAIIKKKIELNKKNWENKRISIAKNYINKLNTFVDVPLVQKNSHHVYHKFVIRTQQRNLLMQHLKRKKIQGVRKKIWNFYYNFLKNLNNNSYYLLNVNSKIQQSFHLFPIIFKDRFIAEKFIKFMQTNGISATFHYIPLHSSPFGKLNATTKSTMHNTNMISNTLLRLPMHQNLNNWDIKIITSRISNFYDTRVKAVI